MTEMTSELLAQKIALDNDEVSDLVSKIEARIARLIAMPKAPAVANDPFGDLAGEPVVMRARATRTAKQMFYDYD